jgi:hypothetical protein
MPFQTTLMMTMKKIYLLLCHLLTAMVPQLQVQKILVLDLAPVCTHQLGVLRLWTMATLLPCRLIQDMLPV